MPRKKPLVQQLKASIRQAAVSGAEAECQELQQLLRLLPQPWPQPYRVLARLLRQSASHVTKSYIAQIVGAAKDPRVIKPLMRAAVAPQNVSYNAVYFWALAAFDCTAHSEFFVRYLLQATDPEESMAACVTVVEAMRGPFGAAKVKRQISALLRRNEAAADPAYQDLYELFRVQAAYALLDTYFTQVDKAIKPPPPLSG